MKPKSIAGIVCQVADLTRTRTFYEKLGFRFGSQQADYLTAYVNWFWVEFHETAGDIQAADGVSLYISVETVKEYYQHILDTGLKPSSEPHKESASRQAFDLSDPDGHRLVFFTKK